MKLFIHTDLLAVEDMHYHFSVGDYYRLPLYGSVRIKPSKNSEMFFRIDKNCSHKINAKLVKKVAKLTERKPHQVWEGLAYFQIELGLFRNFYFFSQYGDEIKEEFDALIEGDFYTGNVTFHLTCGIVESIVNGLWDEFEIPHPAKSWERFPYGLLKIEELVMNEGIEVQSTYEIYPIARKSNEFVVGCDWLFNDCFGGKVLSYYTFKDGGRLEFKKIGTFQFALIDLYFDKYPEYLAIVNGEQYVLRQIIFAPIEEVVQELEEGKFFNEDGYHLAWSLEEKTFRFYDGNLINIAQWEADDTYDRNIIVQFAMPDEAEVLTMTNLEELKEFIQWNETTIKWHKDLLYEAEALEYKFDWNLGQKR
jgi:hypothetical protein